MSAKPTVTWVVCRSSSSAPERLDPGDRRGQVAPPGVDQQLLERRVELLDQAQRRAEPGCRWPASPASSSSTRCTRVATSQSASRAMVWPTRPGEVDRHVEVDRARRRRRRPASRRPRRRRAVKARLDAALGEAERPPEPAGLGRWSRRSRPATSRALKTRLLAEDRALELGSAGPCGSARQVPSSPRVPSCRRCSSSVEPALHLLDVRDVVERHRPWVLASLIDQRAAAEHPVDEADARRRRR